ncbi:MAG TPA: serine hydrolase domain-containing protein [Candidatus Dormibacteraeota bacterium]|nr:serine hydrolase domain-containing protein [Candidatus Dormibacteraeota bacterium]
MIERVTTQGGKALQAERPFAMRAILASLLVITLAAAAPPARPGPSLDDAIAAIRAYAPEAMAEQGTPGLSVAITDRTHTLAIVTLGYANLAAKTPVTPATRFAIGSITKSMTTLALLQLRDEHRVDLNARVRRYLPWFSIDSAGKPILVHELLSHTAGLPDDYSVAPSYLYDVAALREAHTLFTPGTAWSYSNDGYATIGAVIAALDHRPWADSLRARVLDPIGMSDTAPVFTPDTLERAATGYEFRDADRPAPLHPALVPSRVMDFVDPAGSVLSTPEDMALYLRVYLNGGVTASGRRLVSRASFDAMTRPDTYRNGRPAGSPVPMLAEAPQFYRQYGYGLAVFGNDASAGGDHVVGHTGGISGYTACMQANLTRGFGAIAMANLVEEPLHPCAIVLYAMRVLRAQSLGLALPAPPLAPDPALVPNGSDYSGTYTAANGTTFAIAGVPGRVVMIDHGQSYACYPRGPDLLWSSDPHYALFLLHFGRNASKHVVEATYGSQWFGNRQYFGPRGWSHPRRWDAYLGRYENTFWGSPDVVRVIVVKGVLTLDGLQPLSPQRNGTFTAGSDVVRFDVVAGGKTQRMRVDDIDLYRVELP